MTLEPNSEEDQSPFPRCQLPTSLSTSSELISPVLYDLVMWGFAEQNSSGERILRRDIQARLNGEVDIEQKDGHPEDSPLYVGFRCQPCWEAAVTLVAYGQHLCAWSSRRVSCSDLPV
jgi:hypothetical protein